MKSFIIILEQSPISKEIGLKCLKQANKYGVYPEVFPAVYGSEADEIFERLNYKFKNKYCSKMKRNPGVRGCAASHILLLLKCIEEDSPYLILEHDGYLSRKIPSDILTSFNDVIRLDPNNPLSESYNKDIEYGNIEEEHLKKINPSIVKKYFLNLKESGPKTNLEHRISDLIIKEKKKNTVNVKPYLRPKLMLFQKNRNLGSLFDENGLVVKEDSTNYEYFTGCYGYIVKPSGARKVIRYIEEYGLLPADWLFNQAALDIMTTTETIVRIHPEYNALEAKKNKTSTTSNLEN